ncbi:alginate export family protein [Halomonas korlensis]|uniref:Alginate production protein n=1 Tax=Halomonas korlensis TaxID=463301 RepID=A0A1I7ISW1_9GAMM|nr:alginate export family protein [Halomonas korlensis]SFU75992.1 alginate production protein [Halomonas korlensis]
MTYVKNLAVAGIVPIPGRQPRRWGRNTASMLSLALLASLSGFVFAQSSEDEAFLDRFEFEVWVDASFERLGNMDLDSRRSDGLSAVVPELGLGIDIDVSENIDGYMSLLAEGWQAVDRGRERSLEENESSLNVSELYFDFYEITDELSFRVGRQAFADTREWLYAEELDGIRAFYDYDDLSLELSASREREFTRDIFDNDASEERVNNYIVYGNYQLTDDHQAGAYALVRDDQLDSVNPIFYGLRASGAATDSLDYWLDLGHVRGRDGSDRLRGYGVDLGGTYRFDRPLEPSLTLAYAFGSGDSNPDSDVDRQFRQTGLHDNNGLFNGVQDFSYYGETLDPDLSNLKIVTAGLGIRPSQLSSVDLIYHHYEQDVATDDILEGSLLLVPTNGESRDVGQAIDLVLGYDAFEDLRLRSRLGYFMPGDAFGNSASDAYSLVLGFEYTF